LDDGAKTLEESIAMVQIAAASGTTDIVATPHANANYHFDSELIEVRISELRRATNDLVHLHVGCDFHLSARNIEDALTNPGKYTINHCSYLLIEFPDVAIPPASSEIFRRMRSAGMIPVITHPERNRRLQTNLRQLETWIYEECLVQVTAESFLGRFGKLAKDCAHALMDKGSVHFVASDAHDAADRTPSLERAYRHVEDRYGSETAETVFVANPKAALVGEPLEQIEPELTKKRKWYQFSGLS
jgi:protein-tyrosine phosphatase